jgi:hypothetical protein
MTQRQKLSRANRYLEAYRQRVRDARVLEANNRWIGAIYVGGIAAECLLKYAVCTMREVTYLEDLEPALVGAGGHDLQRLLQVAGLKSAIERNRQAANWFAMLQQWHIDLRYDPKVGSASQAQQFLDALSGLSEWILSAIP